MKWLTLGVGCPKNIWVGGVNGIFFCLFRTLLLLHLTFKRQLFLVLKNDASRLRQMKQLVEGSCCINKKENEYCCWPVNAFSDVNDSPFKVAGRNRINGCLHGCEIAPIRLINHDCCSANGRNRWQKRQKYADTPRSHIFFIMNVVNQYTLLYRGNL